MGPTGGPDGCGKSIAGFDPRTVQPVASRYADQGKDYKVPSFVVFSNFLLPCLCQSQTHSFCHSLGVRDQVSHPYKTTSKIVFLQIFIFVFLKSKRVDKMATGISGVQSVFNFVRNLISIFFRIIRKYLNFFTFPIVPVFFVVVILLCVLLTIQAHMIISLVSYFQTKLRTSGK